MKKVIAILLASLLSLILIPAKASAAGGITPSGGGTVTVGQTFTITVTAKGDAFDSLQGVISVSGPVSVVSFTPGGATWLPGKTPANGTQFVGITSATSSLTVASIKLKASSVGAGSVSVSGVKLASNGALVGESGGSAGFTVNQATPKPAATGSVTVHSTSHPDPAQSYEATTIDLSWDAVAAATGYSYLLDQVAGTTPPETVSGTATAVSYSGKAPGNYYFHIRAKASGGFGPVTSFQINIKAPEPKVDTKLAKPSNIEVKKAYSFKNNLSDGTLTGIILSGKTEADYSVLLSLEPAPTLPTGKELKATADKNGNFSYLIDYPIKAGFYTLVVQGQKDKVLTPKSDPIKFELTLGDGGAIRILTDNDASDQKSSGDESFFSFNKYWLLILAILIIALIVTIFSGYGSKSRGRKTDRNGNQRVGL